MEKNWIALQSIPPSGTTLTLEDQEFWQNLITEFAMECRILEPVIAEIFILPQEDGVLFRGVIRGKVSLPCDRCAGEGEILLAHSFDSFEAFPPEEISTPKGKKEQRAHEKETQIVDDAVDTAVIRTAPHGRGIEINPAALGWEEFSLALPVKPLCSENCKGLCPTCGSNLNVQQCSCLQEQGDPRLAALRGIRIATKK